MGSNEMTAPYIINLSLNKLVIEFLYYLKGQRARLNEYILSIKMADFTKVL
jgi:hypothetical protein